MVKDRVAAIILNNKKMLLVTGYDELYYWTPGGKIEEGEAHEACLRRELKSELNIEMTSLKHYGTYKLINKVENEMQVNNYYLVQYEGEFKPGDEITKTIWYSKQNFLDKSPRISEGVETTLIPKLIQDGFF